MSFRFLYSLAMVLAIAVTATGSAGEPQIADMIDQQIAAGWELYEVSPAGVVGDELAIRRLTLDLAGRIPTPAELADYKQSQDPEKKPKLIDRLMSSPDFVLHQTNEFEAMLLAEYGSQNDFREYLKKCFEEGRSWDRMFQDMLQADPANEDDAGARQFLLKRVRNVDDMTNDTSRIFFGVSINCAQCHDHPLVADWLQDHYFGLQTFFSRTYLTKKQHLAERFTGEVKFKTTEGEEKQAQFMFLTGTAIPEPPLQWTDEERKKIEEEIKRHQKDDVEDVPPVPEFSPRRLLVELSLREGENRFFARSIVNRLWARMMGYGLVHPLDQMHSGNPSSHPELLQWLADDLVRHGYDLRRLIRGIASSQAYLRSSVWTGEGDPPTPGTFALATPRALTPRQYSLSLLVASMSPEQLPLDRPAEDWKKTRENWENRSAGLASKLEAPNELFQVSVDEALLLSNSDQVQRDYLRNSGDSLLGYLLKGPREDLVATAFRSVLSRDPLEAEKAACEAFLDSRRDRPEDGARQLVWSLLTSPELRFNH